MIGIVFCKNWAAEMESVAREDNLAGVQLFPTEPHCDQRWQDWNELIAAAGPEAGACDALVVLGADCLPSGLPPCTGMPRRVVRKPHCLEHLASPERLDDWVSQGCFVVTPGWLGRWRQTVARWGYNEPLARAHFSEFARKILLLDTGLENRSVEFLKEASQFFGLEAIQEPVGLEILRDLIVSEVAKAKLELEGK